jgi:hypothetical protein
MDPDENLKIQRDLSEELTETLMDDDGKPVSKDTEDKVWKLAESVQALDGWLMKGGFAPQEWSARINGGLLKRAELAIRVYDEVLDGTESFEGELGTQLAYLLGAILRGTQITLDLSCVEQDEVRQFFELLFPSGHPVWPYVKLESGPGDDVSSD